MLTVQFEKELVTPNGKMILDVDFSVGQGEFVSIFGESGAGKTTILRIIAGLMTPQEGMVSIGGETWLDTKNKIDRKIQEREIGFIFQEDRLFPHMTLLENLQFALGNKKDTSLMTSLIQKMDLQGLEDRKPAVLSGGQRQRVALIRALIRKPKILLLDEPFSALDIELRAKLQDELLDIQRETQVTTIFVTHDLGEVFKLARKVFVLKNGGIVKSGQPAEIFGDQAVSGKFKFSGQILSIIKDGVVNIVQIQIGNNLTKVVATDDEIKGLSVGSKVIVAAKAFNPIILPQSTSS